jgi:hypothetical protein
VHLQSWQKNIKIGCNPPSLKRHAFKTYLKDRSTCRQAHRARFCDHGESHESSFYSACIIVDTGYTRKGPVNLLYRINRSACIA